MKGKTVGSGKQGNVSLEKKTSHSSFKSIGEWESALMTLPDSNFFELLRSVFGNIKTPFNKQRLLEDLFILLSRAEIQKTIAAYIDEKDHKVIAAIALLKNPIPEDLDCFFTGEFSREEIHAVLVNLEERLILYRFRDEEILHLALNPVLEQILAPLIADSWILFPNYLPDSSSSEKNGVPPLSCMCDGRIMAALFAFIFSEEELFRSEAKTESMKVRKKVLDEGKKVLAGLDLELSIETLLSLGLFRLDDRSLVPCGGKIAEFSDLSSVERQEYWTAGAYLCLNKAASGAITETQDGNSSLSMDFGGMFRNRLRRIASFIHRFTSLLDPKKLYPESTLRKFWELLKNSEEGASDLWEINSSFQLSFETFLVAMEKTFLLEKKNAGELQGAWHIVTGMVLPVKNNQDEKTRKPVIAMDTAFSILLYPEIPFADALMLGLFCSVKENAGTETAVSFELTRQSVMRGFDQGINADVMTKLLERLSGNRLDASLVWTLKEWENRYAGVSLHEGVILSLAEDRRYLSEAEPVASLIRRELAPGVYLLRRDDKSQALRALKRAGVDIIAQPPLDLNIGIDRTEAGRRSLNRYSFSSLEFGRIAESHFALSFLKEHHSGKKTARCNQGEADSIKKKFSLILEKMTLTKQERDELAARIERRLVLNENQLEKTSLRYEKLEARGLDYSGKSIIAKQAVESGSMLEVTWPCSGGGINRAVGLAHGLEKSGAESILVLKSFDPENTVRVPLGKISHLRRIKKSIFGK